ncbi:MAG: hypothetical protein FWD16_00160 [Clostridia bacterium]|nr:hypothetical protein [Clostridia bacterium]
MKAKRIAIIVLAALFVCLLVVLIDWGRNSPPPSDDTTPTAGNVLWTADGPNKTPKPRKTRVPGPKTPIPAGLVYMTMEDVYQFSDKTSPLMAEDFYPFIVEEKGGGWTTYAIHGDGGKTVSELRIMLYANGIVSSALLYPNPEGSKFVDIWNYDLDAYLNDAKMVGKNRPAEQFFAPIAYKTTPSRNQKYSIEAFGVNPWGASGITMIQKVRIIKNDTGEEIWQTEPGGGNPAFSWSPNNDFVTVTTSTRLTTSTMVVDVAKASLRYLPDHVDIAKLAETEYHDTRPDVTIEPAKWENGTTLLVKISWSMPEGDRFTCEYTYNNANGKFALK